MIANASAERHASRVNDSARMIAARGERETTVARDTRVLLIGFGNMGQALARGWLARGRTAAAIRVVDTAPGARSAAAALGIAASERVGAPQSGSVADVVVIAVKPNQLAAALADVAQGARGSVFLSIAAGKTLAQLEAGLGAGAAVVRAMPNTPAAIGQGISALVANSAVTPAQRALCEELLAAVGATAWLDDESDMDAVTAVSGSGPAYVFLMIECLERAAVDAGLSPELARRLALATVAGAGAYAAAADEPAAELRRRVTSPGGTTQAALEVLGAERGLGDLIARAVRAAAKRSRELSAV
jgi:pyrroline-5-carboxylate reductase